MKHIVFEHKYDIIVVGGGHAGCEAAHAAAKLGSKVLLITQNLQTIAQMSCNPAMGGIAKGQIVREIDALGGMTGIITDSASIQFRMLNTSKGPAMWSPRAQCDRMMFAQNWRIALEKNKNISFWQDTVSNVLLKDNNIIGVNTSQGFKIHSKAVILCNGTFLGGMMHIGKKQISGGRMGEKPSIGITGQLIELGFTHGRMKTGTPPRLDGRTIDYSKTEEQKGDEVPGKFSFSNTNYVKNQKSCYITYTNEECHDILKNGFKNSPMFNGMIKSTGPRYCPSIEEKLNRFSDKNKHQLFIEPEGRNTIEIYLNGFSTSLPYEIQLNALKKIKGLENTKMLRAGYAVEYDYFPPTQLKHSLETKIINNLFFCGQINGTTGYEEAASQGIIAGINAHQNINDKEKFVLSRSEAYIGVLIDDLITKGTEEPYRMFTSRAEYRLLLRQDNADDRLTIKGYKLGLTDKNRATKLITKREKKDGLLKFLSKQSIDPNKINPILEKRNSAKINQKKKLIEIIARPHIKIHDLMVCTQYKEYLKTNKIDNLILEQAEINVKYQGYMNKEKEAANKMRLLEDIIIPTNFEYDKLHSVSTEAREKLKKINPSSIGQATRISGVSPSDINILLIYMGR